MSPTVILISGANRGLGEGLLSRYLQRDNHIVIAANRDPSHSSSTALQSLPTGKGSRLIIVKIDASNESDPVEAVKSLTAQGIDHIDMVVANAGVANVFPKVSELKIDDLQKHLAPNVFGVVWLYQATRSLLEKSTKPIWATMGSSAAWIEHQHPIPNAAYGPTKAAVHWLTKRIDEEEEKIASIVIQPGWVQTDLGNKGAVLFGVEKATVTVDDSCVGMVKLLDTVTKESHGGKFWEYTGELLQF